MKILIIIEDDESISQMYSFKFETEGYEVASAENGEHGLVLIKKMHPDIVLLDVMMPTMSGDEMLEKMRATPWGKDIKVIILTNMGEQEIPPRFKELGVVGIIQKAEMTPSQVAALVKEKLADPATG
jgi:DNA-binding response OmpR family regulator